MAVTKKMVEKLADDLRVIQEKLEEYKEQKQEVLDNESDKEYPNQERLELLETQVSSLEEACAYVTNAIDELESYE